jgi:catechol 2,3-dioxygenase-like lactoylglutathione lyase family enzyme
MTGTGESAAGKPVLTSTEAVAYVSDFRRSCDYYVSKLGFTLEFAFGDPSFYGLVARDKARLCLRAVPEPVFAGDIREREELLSATFTLNSAAAIKELFREFQDSGVEFVHTLKTESWGAQTFMVHDPDGNRILFAAPAD